MPSDEHYLRGKLTRACRWWLLHILLQRYHSHIQNCNTWVMWKFKPNYVAHLLTTEYDEKVVFQVDKKYSKHNANGRNMNTLTQHYSVNLVMKKKRSSTKQRLVYFESAFIHLKHFVRTIGDLNS